MEHVASITMIGQFPHGIDLHIRNLKWFLSETDYHIYIITLPKIVENLKFKYDKVTFITKPSEQKFEETNFIHFWEWFPTIIKYYNINPDWFLFMEQDIWFFDKFDQFPKSQIKSFLPIESDYHNAILNGKVIQKRIWEGALLIKNNIINNAIKDNVSFAYCKNNKRGNIYLSNWKANDTMDELTLYCAEHKPRWEEIEKAVHIRGPETFHRHNPKIYHSVDQKQIDELENSIWYIDIYSAIAAYYIAGNWKYCSQLNWQKAKEELRLNIKKLSTAKQWMTKPQFRRFETVSNLLNKEKEKFM